MEKLSDHVKEARGNLKNLETELKSAEGRLSNARDSQERVKTDLGAARIKLSEAERHIEETLFAIAAGTVPSEDLKLARATVRGMAAEIEDLDAVAGAYQPVEARLKNEVDDLRQRVTLERKMFWNGVAEEIEGKAREAVGDLLNQALSARELAAWFVFDGAGDHLARIFYQSSRPVLDKEKAELIERYLK
ncbi:MAG: hypothetical protein ABSC19_12570 [Syntrophorhabdales bacterium]|jgi:chromosome segregation ATPase